MSDSVKSGNWSNLVIGSFCKSITQPIANQLPNQLPNYKITRLQISCVSCRGLAMRAGVIETSPGCILAERSLRTHAQRCRRRVCCSASMASDAYPTSISSRRYSFTGMRRRAGSWHSCGHAASRDIALETIAQSTTRDLATGTVIGVWMDARRRNSPRYCWRFR